MKMDTLKRKRSYIKGQITKIETFVKENAESASYSQLQVRLDKVNEHYKNFVEIENQMLEFKDVIESDIDIVDEQYYYIIPRIQDLMRYKSGNTTLNQSMNQSTNHIQGSEFRLPPTTIPPYDGDYREWQSFHDLYVSTVHDNVSLTPAQKFQYLKGLLRGEASSLIMHFPISDVNYIEAFQRLCKRYDRKRYIVDSFIQTYIEQPRISKVTSTNIARLHDTCDEVVRGLKALGPNAEERDPWLIYLAVEKMDDETKQLWRLETTENEFPSFDNLLAFLYKRMDSLQGLKLDYLKGPIKKQISPQTRSMHAAAAASCAFCKEDEHRLFECKKFLNVDVQLRREFIRKNSRCYNCLSDTHSVYQCKSKRKCYKCNKKHNTILHPPEQLLQSLPSSSTSVTTTAMVANLPSTAILPTAQILVENNSGSWELCRALLDSGSQTSFITEECVSRLGLRRTNARISIKGLGDAASGVARGVTSLKLKSRYDSLYQMIAKVLIVPKISSYQSELKWKVDSLQELQNINLADPHFYKAGKLDILLGSDVFFEIISNGKIEITNRRLTAQNTKFGWIVAGTSNQEGDSEMLINLHLDVDATLRRFWEAEEVPEASPFTEEEQFCLQHYQDTVCRAEDGKYIVRLPLKGTAHSLGDSKVIAEKRFNNLERRFSRDTKYHEQYKEFIDEYYNLGHMKISSCTEDGEFYYLPHHGVWKESSSTTKLRVVFDASAKTRSGVSLNDQLAVGPVLQPTLFETLLRFRKYEIIFTADIEKMFRQIWVHPDDTKLQKIMWRPCPQDSLKSYDLLTVTYGTACAPFLATKTLAQLAADYKDEFPVACEIIKRDFYMDDLMSGARSLTEAKLLVEDIIHVLNKGGFKLRKWTSNNEELLNSIPDDNKEFSFINFDTNSQEVSILGLKYYPKNDSFTFKVNLGESKMTKRLMLSEASKIFDPMGWLSPVTIKIKILFQRLWLTKVDWDEQLPVTIEDEWKSIRDQMKNIENIQIQRWLHNKAENLELHGFADASENAFAAVIYSRVKSNAGVKINIVSAKTKVAPLKTITIPRLELCAAVLLTKLLIKALKVLGEERQINYYLWTDSQIVLDWLSSCPRRWKTYVANRVSIILHHTNRNNWSHIASEENPADCASRGIFPNELPTFKLWWNGPHWLRQQEDNWPYRMIQKADNLEVLKEAKEKHFVNMHMCQEEEWITNLLERCSTFSKAVNVIARILRLFRSRYLKSKGNFGASISTDYTDDAFTLIIKQVQRKAFESEIKALISHKSLNKESKLIKYYPFLDHVDILRVGGRIQNAEVSFDVKHPVILPSKHRITSLIIRDEHLKQLHAGPKLLTSILQLRFHIVKCKDEIRRVVGRCMKCTRLKGQQQQQLMGQLPIPRVSYHRPFEETGVDYAGPLLIKASKLRGAKSIKCYLAVFICMATKAVHLELVSDMTTDAFLAALRRFQSRRGICSHIYSDNGSNFRGAEKELQRILELISKDKKLMSYAKSYKIQWHFIPPSAPHFGGIWEAAVKSAKYYLKRVLGETILTFEEMITLLTQIEALLNSRPLCEISKDEIDPLTPGHFLIGHPITLMPEFNATRLKINRLSRWQHVQKMVQHFWKRWHYEYLLSQQQRQKWLIPSNNIGIGDLVVIMDKDVPPARWLMGRVEAIHPGKDGLVRVLTIKTKFGIFKRPITKICILPSGSEKPSGAVC